ncbi:MAG: hypothetical protein ACLUVC_09160 [Longibaculum sp.]
MTRTEISLEVIQNLGIYKRVRCNYLGYMNKDYYWFFTDNDQLLMTFALKRYDPQKPETSVDVFLRGDVFKEDLLYWDIDFQYNELKLNGMSELSIMALDQYGNITARSVEELQKSLLNFLTQIFTLFELEIH